MKVYVLSLSEMDGTHYCTLISPEFLDWTGTLQEKMMGRIPGGLQLPQNVKDSVKEIFKSIPDEINVTIGSAENDAWIKAQLLSRMRFDTEIKAYMYAQKKGWEVVDTCHGHMY